MDQLLGMRVFARVAEFGSFARAADAMDLSRAMVSSHVAALEKHLGTRLLHRTTRKVSVSPEGAVYLAHCQRILAEVAAADDEMRLARDRPQGRLRVDVPISFGKYLLMPALAKFTQRYPQISIEVRFNDRFVDLAAEGVDVAVRAGPITTPDLIAKQIATSRLVTCAAPAYFAAAGMPRSPADLKQYRCIGYLRSDGAKPSWTFRQGKGLAKMRVNCALSFNTMEPITMSALEGQGILQSSDLLVSGYLAEGRLVEILRDYSCEGPALSVVYPRATQHLAKVRVFAEFAAELMRGYQAVSRSAAMKAVR